MSLYTIRQAQAIAKEHGYTLRKNVYGEYRVNKAGGEEATAYYTCDLDDALGTVRGTKSVREKGIITAPKNLVIEKAAKHPIEDTQFFTLRDADTGEKYGYIGWSPGAGFHCFEK
jgi:hypothetical protein